MAVSRSLALYSPVTAAEDSIIKRRFFPVIVACTAGYTLSLTGLYSLWYAKYPRSSFHFINDNHEWQKMDKCGHATTSYYVGKIGYESLRWTGLGERKSAWYGGLLGLAYLTTVEVFDGFSKEWGFSAGDYTANTLGAAFFIGQQLGWHEQKILLKWSFHTTSFAQFNPDQLGANLPQRMLKDYNGQTYWLSANISSLAGMHNAFPKWLNLAFGYGAEGMTGPGNNPESINGKPIPAFRRCSRFFLAPDIDLTRIPVKSKNLRLFLNLIGFIKIPLPAIEMNMQGVKLHPLYF